MKKLIVIVGIIAIASVSNAASFMWKLSTGETYAGLNAYSLTGTSAEAVLLACASKNSSDWNAVFSAAEEGQPYVAGTGKRGAAQGENTGVKDGDKLVFVLVDGNIAAGSKYYVLNEYTIPTGATFDPPATGDQETIAVSLAGQGTFTASDIPEPTSGLLLLLGVAGMALRRRQA